MSILVHYHLLQWFHAEFPDAVKQTTELIDDWARKATVFYCHTSVRPPNRSNVLTFHQGICRQITK